MRIKKYEAPSIEIALHKVRNELGPDALILQTQKVKKRPPFSFFKKEIFEVTAALDNNRDKPTAPASKKKGKNSDNSINAFENRFMQLQRQLADVGSMVLNIKTQLNTGNVKLPEAYTQMYQDMIQENQFDNEIAEKLLFEIKQNLGSGASISDKEIRMELEKLIADRINVSGSVKLPAAKRKVIVLVGPTGVGKTTTTAKLAAHFALVENKKVALLTADTYRIAAVDQLKTYAEIINIPLDVIVDASESRSALAVHSDKDIVLIDTAGRSPYNKDQVEELKNLVKASKPCETHLVLSSATALADTLKAIEAFGKENINNLLFTKLDEAAGLGRLVSILIKTGIPLSYVTNGQNVPQDIAVYDAQQIAGLVAASLEKESIAS